jgi:hypothetical protein
MKVTVRENTMKTITISVTRLIQYINFGLFFIFVNHTGLEYIRYFRLGVTTYPHNRVIVI